VPAKVEFSMPVVTLPDMAVSATSISR